MVRAADDHFVALLPSSLSNFAILEDSEMFTAQAFHNSDHIRPQRRELRQFLLTSQFSRGPLRDICSLECLRLKTCSGVGPMPRERRIIMSGAQVRRLRYVMGKILSFMQADDTFLQHVRCQMKPGYGLHSLGEAQLLSNVLQWPENKEN